MRFDGDGEGISEDTLLTYILCTAYVGIKIKIFFFGRCAQIPAIFENLIPRPEEKKDIFTDTPIFDD